MWNLKTPVKGVPLRYILVALGLLAVLLYLYFAKDVKSVFQRKAGPVTIAESAEEAKWVEPDMVTPPEKIQTYSKVKLAGKLKMPELALMPGLVLATATIPPHAGSTTAVAKMDNGVTQIIYRQEATPFFQIKKDFRAEARYLFTGTNKMEAEVIASPLRLGPVEITGGAGVEVRRDDSALGFRSYVGAVYRF